MSTPPGVDTGGLADLGQHLYHDITSAQRTAEGAEPDGTMLPCDRPKWEGRLKPCEGRGFWLSQAFAMPDRERVTLANREPSHYRGS